MNQSVESLEEENILSTIYIRTLCVFFSSARLSMMNREETNQYKLALVSVVESISQKTCLNPTSYRNRRALMAESMKYLQGELERNCTLLKFKDMLLANTCLAKINGLIADARPYMPTLGYEGSSTRLVDIGSLDIVTTNA